MSKRILGVNLPTVLDTRRLFTALRALPKTGLAEWIDDGTAFHLKNESEALKRMRKDHGVQLTDARFRTLLSMHHFKSYTHGKDGIVIQHPKFTAANPEHVDMEVDFCYKTKHVTRTAPANVPVKQAPIAALAPLVPPTHVPAPVRAPVPVPVPAPTPVPAPVQAPAPVPAPVPPPPSGLLILRDLPNRYVHGQPMAVWDKEGREMVIRDERAAARAMFAELSQWPPYDFRHFLGLMHFRSWVVGEGIGIVHRNFRQDAPTVKMGEYTEYSSVHKTKTVRFGDINAPPRVYDEFEPESGESEESEESEDDEEERDYQAEQHEEDQHQMERDQHHQELDLESAKRPRVDNEVVIVDEPTAHPQPVSAEQHTEKLAAPVAPTSSIPLLFQIQNGVPQDLSELGQAASTAAIATLQYNLMQGTAFEAMIPLKLCKCGDLLLVAEPPGPSGELMLNFQLVDYVPDNRSYVVFYPGTLVKADEFKAPDYKAWFVGNGHKLWRNNDA